MEAAAIEHEYVHAVYEQIAPHFSSTRFSKWPQVAQFLGSLAPGSVVCDVGCGNGKYLIGSADKYSKPDAKPQYFTVGCDRSENLARICMRKGSEVLQADNLELPFRNDSFDAVLSIAVLHHLASEERRKQSLSELVRVMRPESGRCLIYVWAFEQEGRFEGKYNEQDAYVPWKFAKRFQSNSTANSATVPPSGGDEQKTDASKDKELLRFYHLFKKGELEELVEAVADLEVLRSGYDHQNWWVEIRKKAKAVVELEKKSFVDMDNLNDFLEDVMNEIDEDEYDELEAKAFQEEEKIRNHQPQGHIHDEDHEADEVDEIFDFERFSDDEDVGASSKSLESVQNESKVVMQRLEKVVSAEGVDKLKRRIQSEHNFITSLDPANPGSTSAAVSSNISYYAGVLDILENHQDVVNVCTRFNFNPEMPLRKETDDLCLVPREKISAYCSVDIVSFKGLCWVKVRATRAKHIEMAAKGGGKEGEKNVLELASGLVRCASQNPVDYRIPSVVFYFSKGVSESIARTLSEMGVIVEGRVLSHKTEIPRLPALSIQYPQFDALNFDVSTLLALVSDLTNNPISATLEYDVPSLAQQAVSERSSPVLPLIREYIQGKQWIVTKAALERFTGIIDIIAGPTEKLRAQEFLAKAIIIENDPSARAMEMSSSFKETPAVIAQKKLIKLQFRRRSRRESDKVSAKKQKKREARMAQKGLKAGGSSGSESPKESAANDNNGLGDEEKEIASVSAESSVSNTPQVDTNFLIFGTADRMRIPTVTSNVSFVRSCQDKGLRFCVLLHGARALTERKAMLAGD